MSKILVVDDDEIIAGIVERFLTMKGFEVIKAFGGESAIDVLRSDAGIGLIIMDMRMPKVSGMDVLKENESGRKVPALFLTGAIDAGRRLNELEGKSITEDDILFKPIDFPVLLKKVKEKLGI